MQAPNFTLDDALRGMRKRKSSIVILTLGIPTLVMVATLMAPKKYTSSSKLFIRLGRENSSLDATATLGENPVVAMPMSRESEINSIAEMINNKALIEQVVDEVGVDNILNKKKRSDGETEREANLIGGALDGTMRFLRSIGVVNNLEPREKAIIELQKKLTIEPIAKSNIVLLKYESHDPKVSQLVVDTITNHYLTLHASLHRNRGAYGFLEKQTSELKKQLNLNEKEFEELKNSFSIADLENERKVLVERRAKISGIKLENDAQMAGLESEVKELLASLGNLEKSIVIEETVGVGNEGVDGMRQELYRLEVERERLLAKFTPDSSKVKAIVDQIRNAQKILTDSEANRREMKKGPNEVYQKLLIELNTKRPLLESTKRKSATYHQQLVDLNQEISQFVRNETRYRQLERIIALDDANYRKYVNNLQQARIDSLLKSENLSNISIAQPASFEPKPSKPNKLLNLVLGMVFGMFVAIGQAVYREYRSVVVSSEEQLQRATELPVLGRLSTVPGEFRIQPTGNQND